MDNTFVLGSTAAQSTASSPQTTAGTAAVSTGGVRTEGTAPATGRPPSSSAATAPAPSSSGSTELTVSESSVTFFGRHYEDPRFGAWFFNWTGAGFLVRFSGTSLAADFISNHGMETAATQPYIRVYVDDGEPARLKITQNGRVTLAEGLSAGEHTVRVVKLNETMLNSLGVQKLIVSSGGRFLPPPALPARRIEVIGDSITCGYGNVPPFGQAELTSEIEDGTQTYGAFIGAHFGADTRIAGVSGAAVYRNYLGTVSNFFTRYAWSDYYDEIPYDFTSWTPDLVILNLGTNDFDKGSTREEFLAGGKKWLEFLRQKYPGAVILWTYGVMNRQSDPVIREVVAARHQAGDSRVSYHPLTAMNTAADGIGGGGHPTAATHRKMADELIPVIRTLMRW